MNPLRSSLFAISLLALAACQQAEAPPAPEATPEEDAASTPAEPVSIIRQDIEEAVMIPLEPLAVTIGFPDGGTDLPDAAIEVLQTVLDSRQAREGGAITLSGHGDSGGQDGANMRVSQRRADAVKDWLVERGVAEDRITTVAFGEQNPVAPNALSNGSPNEEGRAANRRVEVLVNAPDGVVVEAPADEPEG